MDTFEGEGDGSTDDGEGDSDRGDWFGFSVAVGVAFVGWFRGDFQSEPNSERAKNI